jgi:hypothetical protein
MLALPLSDAMPALPAPSCGELNVISSSEVPGLLPGVPLVKLVVVKEEGSLVLVVAGKKRRSWRMMMRGGRTCRPSVRRC